MGSNANGTAQSTVREERATQMAAMGATFAEIAEALGYAEPAGAHKAVMRALAKRAAETNQHRDELIAGELETTRLMIRGLMPAIIKDGNARNAEVVVKVLERRAKLMGWDAPAKVDVKVTDQMRSDIDALLEDMANLDAVAAANLLAEQRG